MLTHVLYDAERQGIDRREIKFLGTLNDRSQAKNMLQLLV